MLGNKESFYGSNNYGAKINQLTSRAVIRTISNLKKYGYITTSYGRVKNRRIKLNIQRIYNVY